MCLGALLPVLPGAEITELGAVVVPFVLVAVLAAAGIVVVLRRTRRIVGFDRDEATNYVWANLSRDQRRRIALGHVAAIVDAVYALSTSDDPPADDAEMLARVRLLLPEDEVPLDLEDVARVIELQYRYADEKRLL